MAFSILNVLFCNNLLAFSITKIGIDSHDRPIKGSTKKGCNDLTQIKFKTCLSKDEYLHQQESELTICNYKIEKD